MFTLMIGATLNRLPSKEEETRRTPMSTNAPSSRRFVPMRYYILELLLVRREKNFLDLVVGSLPSGWQRRILGYCTSPHLLLDDGSSSGPSSSSS